MTRTPATAPAPIEPREGSASRKLLAAVHDALRAVREPDRAAGQQRYMKSAMPFLGVRVPVMRRTARAVFGRRPPPSAEVWQATILALWREAKYREQRMLPATPEAVRNPFGPTIRKAGLDGRTGWSRTAARERLPSTSLSPGRDRALRYRIRSGGWGTQRAIHAAHSATISMMTDLRSGLAISLRIDYFFNQEHLWSMS